MLWVRGAVRGFSYESNYNLKNIVQGDIAIYSAKAEAEEVAKLIIEKAHASGHPHIIVLYPAADIAEAAKNTVKFLEKNDPINLKHKKILNSRQIIFADLQENREVNSCIQTIFGLKQTGVYIYRYRSDGIHEKPEKIEGKPQTAINEGGRNTTMRKTHEAVDNGQGDASLKHKRKRMLRDSLDSGSKQIG